ncbi:MAG: hypothetical protein J0I68_15905 [Achromobacter sp.]|uniref:hypothetical protein n=1 Tax=Achromobacter TaxID=222 RepID=UPI0006C534F0|nr:MULTISPECIES: hypothetical protein [Achromobacter]MBN9640029.1 hypothetical protein [Achromobacter sp.]CUK12222.1 Uncharacterised protein [Achromobacter sp. 2789STDY5608615]
MDLKTITDTATTPALALLPAVMETSVASVMLLAIGLQESRVMLCREIGSPARGFGLFGKDGFARCPIVLAVQYGHCAARHRATVEA